MLSKRHNNPRFQKITRLVAAWFILFAIVVPALHRHGDTSGFFSKVIAKAAPFTQRHVHSPAAALRTESGVVSAADDDCALCQWFSVGFTPMSAQILLFATTACMLLVLSVRLIALCRRPLPRRGLRAPPALFA